MTIQTCKRYYEVAKKRGDKEQMEFWKKRAELKGGEIAEEVGLEIDEKEDRKRKR